MVITGNSERRAQKDEWVGENRKEKGAI